MNASHVIATSGATGALAQVLMYLSAWPLAPMDEKTALAFATLLFIAFGGLVVRSNNKASQTPTS